MENPELLNDGGVYMTKKEYRKFLASQKKRSKRKIFLQIIYAILLIIGIIVIMA